MFTYSVFEHSYDIPYMRHKEPISDEYSVKVNGEEIPVYTCRISEYPFNTYWTGEQRPANQTELASFVNIVSDETLHFEVTAKFPYSRVMVKPYSKDITADNVGGVIAFDITDNGQYVLQCDSYHRTLYIFNSKPIEAPNPDSVTHYFGAGVHMAGKIELHSNDTVYVDKDALVFGWLYANGAKNIRIYGGGLFDGSGEGRVNARCYEPYTNGNLKFYNCENVSIEGVMFRNSAIWCVNIFHCLGVSIDGIKVFGQWRYNTDGIDIVNSRDVTVKNSLVHSFDDSVCIKGIDRFADTDCENITVENCVLWCDWGNCIEIGFETACKRYRNILYKNCDIIRAASVALSLHNGDYAEVSDITYSDIRVELNDFDTPMELQTDPFQRYSKQNEIAVPYIINVNNDEFRVQYNTKKSWGMDDYYPEGTDFGDVKNGCVHDVKYESITVYYDSGIPMKDDGSFNIKAKARSTRDGVEHYNITVSDVNVIYKGKKYPVDIKL